MRARLEDGGETDCGGPQAHAGDDRALAGPATARTEGEVLLVGGAVPEAQPTRHLARVRVGARVRVRVRARARARARARFSVQANPTPTPRQVGSWRASPSSLALAPLCRHAAQPTTGRRTRTYRSRSNNYRSRNLAF